MKLTLNELKKLESILHNYLKSLTQDEYRNNKDEIDFISKLDMKLVKEILDRYCGKRSD